MSSLPTQEATPERPVGLERYVHEPHRVGLPPLLPYLRSLWQRREFAFELARTRLRAQHFVRALWRHALPFWVCGIAAWFGLNEPGQWASFLCLSAAFALAAFVVGSGRAGGVIG